MYNNTPRKSISTFAKRLRKFFNTKSSTDSSNNFKETYTQHSGSFKQDSNNNSNNNSFDQRSNDRMSPIRGPSTELDDDKSIHTGNQNEIHDVPLNVLKRPIPPVLEEGKVSSLMESMKNNDDDVPPIDVLWVKGEKDNSSAPIQTNNAPARISLNPLTITYVENEDHLRACLAAAGIDFYATWCGPCKMIGPEFHALSNTVDDVVFLKIDIDENEEIASEYDINTMPTFAFIRNKQLLELFSGARIEKVKELIAKYKG